MDAVAFVQNIKIFCERQGVKPTVACRESGAGKDLINQIERQRSMPSVEKVQLLAQYLGVTVSELLGETQLHENCTFHDSAVVLQPSDVKRLTVAEVEMVMAYRRASPEEQQAISLILSRYKEKDASHVG